MAFEVYSQGLSRAMGIPPGTVRIDGAGQMRVSAADLRHVGIGDVAVLLIERQFRCLALKAPGQGSIDGLVRVMKSLKQTGRGHPDVRVIRVLGALKMLGVNVEVYRGTHDTTFRDGMLVIPLGELAAPTQQAAPLQPKALRLEQQAPEPQTAKCAAPQTIDETVPTWAQKARRKG